MSHQIEIDEAQRVYEAALIELMGAENSKGLKIILGPSPKLPSGCNPLKVEMPLARDYGVYLAALLRNFENETVFVNGEGVDEKGEETLALHAELLVNAWRATLRFERLTKS